MTCIDSYHDNNLVLSGSVDGTARLISSLTGKVGHVVVSSITIIVLAFGILSHK